MVERDAGARAGSLADTGNVLRLIWAHERGQIQFALFSTLVLPATVAYMGLMILGDDVRARVWWMGGAVALGLGMAAMSQVGFGMLHDRFTGRLELLQTTPVSKAGYFGAHLAIGAAQCVTLVVAALALLSLVGWSRFAPASAAAALLAGTAAGGAIGGLGAVFASRARDFDRGATAVAIAAIGLGVASPVFYALEDLPALLRPIALLSPFTHVTPLVRSAFLGTPLPLPALFGALALSAALNAVCYRSLRWNQ